MKFRYQNQTFKKSLDHARHFKRHARKLPQTPRQIFFARLGLGSWPARAVLLLLVAGLVYLVYVPNFLFVRQVKISGLKLPERKLAEEQIGKFLKKVSPWPQKNLLLLSAQQLKNNLEKSDIHIKSAVIYKGYPNSLIVEIQPRYPGFLVSGPTETFEVAMDGTIMSKQPASGNLPRVEFTSTGNWVVGQKILLEQAFSLMSSVLKELPDTGSGKAVKFIVDPKEGQDLIVQTNNGYQIKLDIKTQWVESKKNLEALESQINLGPKLAYIDLRVPERAYVCYKDRECAQPRAEVSGAATTTPKTLNK